MKYDRIQEMLRYITPGLYFLALVLVVNFDTISNNEQIRDTIAKFSAIIIVLLPFVGFVIGYFIECLMAWFERLLYWVCIPRPSRVVLNGKVQLYVLEDNVRKAITNGTIVVNKDADRYQQIAKQVVGSNEIVSRCYYQSIMARHIWGAQLFASIYYLSTVGGWSWCHFAWVVLLLLLLTLFWYHQTCVYMKYLFAEYSKTLKS